MSCIRNKFLVFALAAAAFADERDDLVKGLWLEVHGFPKNAEVLEFNISGNGEVSYSCNLGEGWLTVERWRKNFMNDGSAFTMDKVAKFVADYAEYEGFMEEDDVDVDENPGELTAIFKYPVATVTYEGEEEAGTSLTAHLFIFTDDWVFHTRFADIAYVYADSDPDEVRAFVEKFPSRVEGLYKSMNLRDDGAKDAGMNDDSIEGLWLEVPGFPKNASSNFSFGDGGEVSYTREL